MSLLVVGGSGFLGAEVVRRAVAARHAVSATYLTRPGPIEGATWHAVDIRDRQRMATVVADVRPTVIVNAAYRQADWATTADGAVNVALAAAEAGARLVQVSSDAVFSGLDIRYAETDPPDPITPYGAAKAAAEVAILALDQRSVVARTSLIIGDGASSHERFVHALAAGERPGALFTDDVRCPVHVTDLAAVLLELAASDVTGVRHVAGADAVSRYELGRLIARRDGLDPDALSSGTRAETELPGPLDVRLDSSVTQAGLRTRLRGVREFLRAAG